MNQRDPTADRLLRTARRLFATQGYDRASVRAITRAARANLGAVTYHFGSKGRLYAAVLDRLFADLAERLAAAARSPAPAPQRLRAVVDALFAFFTEQPDAPRIILRFLARGSAAPDAVVNHMRRALAAITDAVRDGQAAGELRTLDPVLIAFTILSQSVWFAVARPYIAATTGRRLDRPEAAAGMARHVADVALRAFRTEGASA